MPEQGFYYDDPPGHATTRFRLFDEATADPPWASIFSAYGLLWGKIRISE